MQQVIIDRALLKEEAHCPFNEFIQLLSSVSEDRLNAIPFENSWTAAQVGDHVVKFLSGVTQIKNLPTEKTMRHCNDFTEPLKMMFLNFNIKMKAPDFVYPDKQPLRKDLLIEKLLLVTKEILHLIMKENLSLLCKGAEFPSIGELTRLEWVYSGTYHTQRHTHQLKNVIHHL
jgi:hypothetical protein